MAKNPQTILLTNSKLGSTIKLNEEKYLYFGGAGYYLLQSNTEMINIAASYTLEYGIGSATSRTLTGTTKILVLLEQAIAGFFNTEDAVYLPSGYLTNFAAFQALNKLNLFDKLFLDENAHYCIADAALITGKEIIRFEHLNHKDLLNKIRINCTNGQKPLIASDGVFPITADLAPVAEYLKIAEQFNGLV